MCENPPSCRHTTPSGREIVRGIFKQRQQQYIGYLRLSRGSVSECCSCWRVYPPICARLGQDGVTINPLRVRGATETGPTTYEGL